MSNRTSISTEYNLYIDLWDFTLESAESIAKKLSEEFGASSIECCSHINPSCNQSFWLRHDDKDVCLAAQKRFNSLQNIAHIRQDGWASNDKKEKRSLATL